MFKQRSLWEVFEQGRAVIGVGNWPRVGGIWLPVGARKGFWRQALHIWGVIYPMYLKEEAELNPLFHWHRVTYIG